MSHGILFARYAEPEPEGGYSPDAPVIVTHAHYGEQFRRANDDIEGGGMLAYLLNGGTIDPYIALPVDLVVYARTKRWETETAGITVSGIPVETNDRSKVMITGGRVAASADAGWTTVWDGADGEGYPIDAAAMIAIGAAVQAHVNACFVAFAAVRAGLDADPPTITTTAEIDAAFAAIVTVY